MMKTSILKIGILQVVYGLTGIFSEPIIAQAKYGGSPDSYVKNEKGETSVVNGVTRRIWSCLSNRQILIFKSMNKAITILSICLLLFSGLQSAKAQFKYEELSATQKWRVTRIEAAYNDALSGQKANISYNDFMLKISKGSETRNLPLVEIESISVEQNNDGYYLKLYHIGGWDFEGFYNITDQQSAETVKNQLQLFLDKFDPFDPMFLTKLCISVRELNPSKEDPDFYDFEYKMLKLAGVKDPQKDSDEEVNAKMRALWKNHAKDLQCLTLTRIFPYGNYLRQLARSDNERIFELLLDNYGLDPNIIDFDGCTALDYLEAQIVAVDNYAEYTLKIFKKYRDIMLKYGAKSANELGGKCL